jgi:hypothetical protein
VIFWVLQPKARRSHERSTSQFRIAPLVHRPTAASPNARSRVLVHPAKFLMHVVSQVEGEVTAGRAIHYATGGFALASWHWASLVVFAAWFRFFLRNMRRKDESMSRHPAFAAYNQRTGMFLPSLGIRKAALMSTHQ